MTAERMFRGVVGVLLLAATALTVFHSRNWMYFTVFMAVMMAQSAVTDRCPLLMVLEKLGLPRCQAKPRRESPVAARVET